MIRGKDLEIPKLELIVTNTGSKIRKFGAKKTKKHFFFSYFSEKYFEFQEVVILLKHKRQSENGVLFSVRSSKNYYNSRVSSQKGPFGNR